MGNIREKIVPVLRKRSVLVLVLCGFAFAASIMLLFTQQKKRLDAEFESMITSGLNIHTHSTAGQIDEAIADADITIRMVEAMLPISGSDETRAVLERVNAANPACVIEYASGEELAAHALSDAAPFAQRETYERLARGEAVVGGARNGVSWAGDDLFVILPLRENERTTGALYTRIQADGLLPKTSASAVYQDAQSCLITGDGDIFLNTFLPEQSGNLFATLEAYGLTQAEIDRVAGIIRSEEIDSATFTRKGQTYFVSADRLSYNGWHMVSFVRGPDVLLRSAKTFQDVLRTSVGAVLLTVAAACVVFMLLLLSKKKLEEEQRRNSALAQRHKAMFDQHSAFKVVFDAVTGVIVDANPAILSYFGYTQAELLGRRIQEFNLLPPDILNEKFSGEPKGGVLFSAAPHRLKNGETRLFDAYASVILDKESKLLYAILFDVTDRERYRNELMQEKELLRTTLQSIGDGVVTTDNLGRITSLNTVAQELTGWKNDETKGKPFSDVFRLQNEETGEPVDNPIRKVLETGRTVGLVNHTEMVNRCGQRIPIADSAAPIRMENGQTFGVVMVFRDVSDEKKHHTQIEYLSYHDSLTGLYNRRYVEENLNRLDTAENLPISVVMGDVNGLKLTNDVFGHKAGDTLLQNVAGLLVQSCRQGSLIARWGGDEFVILMPRTRLSTAEAYIQSLKNTRIGINGSGLRLSLSLGCACKDTAEGNIQAAMREAEEYMYHQKLLDGKSYRNAIINTLLATLYEKSNETEEHSKRMEKHCHYIGRKLRLSSKEMDELSLLALLHDMGKVSIDPRILQKPGALTSAEWDEMKRHPEIGYRIAQATPELTTVSDLILAHHERWDGKGYPRGLKGEDIPLACRILAVTDAYDAMTNDRAYRSAKSSEEAIDELEKNAGAQFDSNIVRIFVQFLRSEKQTEDPNAPA